ncbi:hypothetical protein D3C80_1139680 [compost metagenome]
MDETVNGAFVGIFQSAECAGFGFFQCSLGSRVGLVCRSRVQIEFGRLGTVCAFEYNILSALSDIETFFEINFIFSAVYNDRALASDIDNTQLAALQEVSYPKLLQIRCQYNIFVNRISSAHDHAVFMGQDKLQLIRSKNNRDVELLAQALCVKLLYFIWMRCKTSFHYVFNPLR